MKREGLLGYNERPAVPAAWLREAAAEELEDLLVEHAAVERELNATRSVLRRRDLRERRAEITRELSVVRELLAQPELTWADLPEPKPTQRRGSDRARKAS